MGKTAAVRELAKRTGLTLVEVNFERKPVFASLFKQDLDPRRIMRELGALVNQTCEPGKTLLFFDEIQDCPEAITSLRYFYEEVPDLHVVAAGSLLEFVLGKVSVPVGRIEFATMYPMSFTEFLEGTDRAELCAYIPCFETLATYVNPPSAIGEALRAALKEYVVVGGMPEAVAIYAQSRSFGKAHTRLDDLLQAFRQDTHKYAAGGLQLANLSRLLDLAFAHVGNHVKYTKLIPDEDSRRTKKSIELLEQALLVHHIMAAQPHGLPLGAFASDKIFRLNFIDIGLGQRAAGVPIASVIQEVDLLKAYQGRLADQFVGQQLLAETGEGGQDQRLFFWMRTAKNSSAEVDFLVVREGKIIPIEVKSGKKGRLRSLSMLLDETKGEGICLHDTFEVKKSGAITFAPLYTII